MLQVLPQFHVGGWNVQALLAWWKGATVVLEPAFDPARALALIAEKHVTTMMGVPATYLFMSQEPGFASADLWTLRHAVVGGAPMPEALLEAWHERGVEIVQGYGLTEAAPNVLCLPPEDAARKRGYAGKPYPHVDVALRDPESGELLDGATEGELVVKGPNVFAGYWRNAEATAAAFADGWLLTGDVAARDDEGYYRIVGRTKDMVISGGENVYPAEIENVLHEHEAVAEAAVVGVPDERWGEACLAFVVLGRRRHRGGAARACRSRLARYKVPRGVRFVESLPRNALDKVVKSELAGARAMKQLTARGERTRQKLLDAAERIFAELGYHDASIVKITEAAGVGQGTFYLYFAGKQQVFDEVVLDLNDAGPPCDDRGGGEGDDARRARAARLRRVLPLHGRAPGALPDHPAGRVRLAGDARHPLRAADRGLRRRPAAGDGGGGDRARATPRCSPGA